jgi:L-rhamnose-H+ transport protein
MLILAGGFFMGSFLLPTRGTPRWPWECYWFLYSIFGTLLCPWILAFTTNQNLITALGDSPVDALLKTLFFGALWGIGGCLFGIGVSLVGMALGFALIIGLTMALGSILPMMIAHPEDLMKPAGHWTLAGVAVLLAGITLLSLAGKRRDVYRKTLQVEPGSRAPAGIPPGRFAAGLLVCVVSGVFSSMLNIGFVFSRGIESAVKGAGSSPQACTDAVWAVLLTGGFLANIGLSAYKLTRNRTWHLLREAPIHYWPLGVLVGVLWYAGPPLYGRGSLEMGKLGSSIGWGIFMASLIATSNFWGIVLGEWRKSGPGAKRFLALGLVVLLCGIVLLARAAAFG